MTDDQHLLAAHCDAKGKMWSNLRLSAATGFAWIDAAACATRSSPN
jgi:folate-binding Fe-S cluster repair protein YgfZ